MTYLMLQLSKVIQCIDVCSKIQIPLQQKADRVRLHVKYEHSLLRRCCIIEFLKNVIILLTEDMTFQPIFRVPVPDFMGAAAS